MINWTPLNDDQTLIGLEGKYIIIKGVLYVYIEYTNHLFDVISDLIAIPNSTGCHLGLYPYGDWLAAWVNIQRLNNPEIKEVQLIGCSMGGLMMIAANKLDDVTRVVSIGGLSTTRKVHPKAELWLHRGDIIPWLIPWFKRPKKIKYLNNKWQWPIKAHCSYSLNKLVEDIVNEKM